MNKPRPRRLGPLLKNALICAGDDGAGGVIWVSIDRKEIAAFVTTHGDATRTHTQNNERHNLNNLLVIAQVHAQVLFHR